MTSDHFRKGLRAYQDLCWPAFKEYEGCVLRDNGFREEYFRQWQRVTEGDRANLEDAMNHVHIVAALRPAVEDPDQDLIIEFGRLLRDTWECKLRRDFPSRRFEVEFYQPAEPLDLAAYEVTFHQLDENAGA